MYSPYLSLRCCHNRLDCIFELSQSIGKDKKKNPELILQLPTHLERLQGIYESILLRKK